MRWRCCCPRWRKSRPTRTVCTCVVTDAIYHCSSAQSAVGPRADLADFPAAAELSARNSRAGCMLIAICCSVIALCAHVCLHHFSARYRAGSRAELLVRTLAARERTRCQVQPPRAASSARGRWRHSCHGAGRVWRLWLVAQLDMPTGGEGGAGDQRPANLMSTPPLNH